MKKIKNKEPKNASTRCKMGNCFVIQKVLNVIPSLASLKMASNERGKSTFMADFYHAN